MKKPGQMTKAELIRCVKALEKGAPVVNIAFEHERLLHELQVHQIELETQNRELREAQLLLESSRDRYADLYDFAPVGYVTLDEKGVIGEINLTAAGMIGVERTRLVGVPFHLHIPREDLARFREHLNRLSDVRSTVELHLAGKSGRALPVMMQSVLVYDAEKKGFLCRSALTDITALKQAEEVARRNAELNQGILRSLTAHIAVLDKDGDIIAVNDAWSRFAQENAHTALARTGPGTNYLEICRRGIEESDADAKKALDGIQAVLKRARPGFAMEYPCHSPQEDRWFFMSVTPLGAARGGAVISHLDISQRRVAEQAVFDNEARLRAILDTAAEGIITIDEGGIIESLNKAAEKLFGYPPEEAVGQNISLLMPSPYREEHDRYLAHYRETGERKIIGHGREVSGRRKDGSVFPMELFVSEVRLATRRLFTGFVRDITQRRQADEALRESEERLRQTLETNQMGMFEINLVSGESYWNTVEYELLGLKPGEAPAGPETFFRIVHPDDISRLRAQWEEATRTGDFDVEFRIVRADGRERWLAGKGRFAGEITTGTEAVGVQGPASRFLGVNFDITARKRDEQRRQLQYETSRLLAASGSLAETVPKLLQAVAKTFEWDVGEFWEVLVESEKMRVVHVWHAPGEKLAAFVKHSLKLSFSMFDGLPGRVLSTRQPDWIPEISQCPHFLRKQAAIKAGLRSALAFPIQVNQHTLGVMAFLTHGRAELDDDLLQMFASVGSQIGQFMERKNAEQAVLEAHEFTKQVIDGAPGGLIVYDRAGRCLVWSSFMEQITGFRAEDVLKKRAVEVFPFLREEHLHDMFEQALAGDILEAPDIPYDLPRPGKKGWVSARFAPLRDARQEIIGVIVTVRDVTERRRLESELLEISDREQQRIGHDLHDGLGQQLTALEMKCFLLLEDLVAKDIVARRERLREQARQISHALRACVTVTRSLARGLAPVHLREHGLMDALKQLAHNARVPGKIECEFICPRPVMINNPQITGHLYRIAQEAVNNALKHARTRHIHIDLAHDAGTLHLQIKDDGRGLPRNRERLSGMGLEVMRHRAHVIGASLEIDSKPGQGVSVTCTLPLENHEH